MPKLVVRGPKEFESGFDRIRRELDIQDHFPPEVRAAADACTLKPTERLDVRDLDFVAVDPPGATDLDQAFFAQRDGDGFIVYYAIADVGAFVQPGDPIDQEARLRGATMYSPDQRSPLHPAELSENKASLLPGVDRPALLWTLRLDAETNPTSTDFRRATIQVREAISYAEAQRRIDENRSESLALLKAIGLGRQAREAERGGISLNLPAQEIQRTDHGYQLTFDTSLPVEGWNAQMSLLSGMVAGQTMADAGVGILRTLPPPKDQNLDRLKRTAEALHVEWPTGLSYPDFIRSLSPTDPASNVVMVQATRTFRGAGYESFNGELPDQPLHGAISSLYSHVTAPLRRLVDRFANEVLLSIYADVPVPAWALEALDELPSIMGKTRQKESALDRRLVDFAESLVLEQSQGQSFAGTVVDLTDNGESATVQIAEPAVVARISGEGRSLAEQVEVRLETVDTESGTVDFVVH